MSALRPSAKADLVYDVSKRDSILDSLVRGGKHLFYGPGGVGKTYEAMELVTIARARGQKVHIVAISNEASERFGGKGLYNTFGWTVDRVTGKPRSKLDDLCMACRRSNPYRKSDPRWDGQQATKDEQKDYDYMKRYTLKNNGDVSKMSDLDIISRINRSYAKYKQLDCAEALYKMQCDWILMEEAFMIGSPLYKFLDEQMRKYRACDESLGGAGAILSGDALQLKPVNQVYFFQSDVWNTLSPQVHLFGTLRRFDDDPEYIEFLTNARLGIVTDAGHSMLLSRRRSQVDDKPAYSLCRTREETNTHNMAEIAKLKEKTTIYVVAASDQFYYYAHSNDDKPMLLAQHLIPEAKRILDDIERPTELLNHTRIAVGARVIITHNDRSTGVYNGFVGTVTVVNYVAYNAETAALYGKKGSITSVSVQFDRTFEHNMNELPKGTKLVVGDTITFKLPEDRAPTDAERANEGRMCKILSVGGSSFTSQDTCIIRKINIEHRKGTYSVIRTQFPFSLGWARTTHKAQGATVEDRCAVILSGRMGPGQAYVTVSRLKTKNDLIVENDYDRAVFFADRAALEFDKQIQETGKWVVDKPSPQENDMSDVKDDDTAVGDIVDEDAQLKAFLMS
jgi:hypothetical protein